MKRRGIVIAPNLKLSKEGNAVEWPTLEPSYLRKCLLYWDIMDYPQAILDGETSDAELNLLTKEGILQRTRGHFFKKEGGKWELVWWFHEHPQEFWNTVQLYALLKHINSDEHWTMGQIGEQFQMARQGISEFAFAEPAGDVAHVVKVPNVPFLPSGHISEGSTVELELTNALPVPAADVRIEAILEFKQKRHAELLHLRHALDKLELGVANAVDKALALRVASGELEVALLDLHKTLDEARMKKILPTVTASISIDDVGSTARNTIVGALAAQSMGLNALVGAVVGAVISAIKLSITLNSRKPKDIPSDWKDYAYLYHVEKELGK